MFLTQEQVEALTGKVQPAAQVRALRAMGIEHMVRPDGRPVVLQRNIDALEAAMPKPAFKIDKQAVR